MIHISCTIWESAFSGSTLSPLRYFIDLMLPFFLVKKCREYLKQRRLLHVTSLIMKTLKIHILNNNITSLPSTERFTFYSPEIRPYPTALSRKQNKRGQKLSAANFLIVLLILI